MTKAIKWSDLELVRILGEGQAGKVWLAKLKCQFKEFSVGSCVAVKCYKNWVLEEPGQFERIIRELELGRKIKHPNLVKTLSIVRDPEGNPSLVMDYHAGETLESYLEERRRQNKLYIDLDFAFKIIGGLAAAINAIHQAGAIHRDVKPVNIILSDDGPILMDLGVISSKDFPEQTTSGAFLGTIRYAAPEYLFGESYGANIDIYGLGAIAYEIFEGKRFFTNVTQWARLIVDKRHDSHSVDYHALLHRYGLNATEFIKFIIDRTLAYAADTRVIDIDNLLDSIKNRLWERPFYIANGKLVTGEPKVNYLGVQNEESKTALCEVVKDLRRKISEEDRAFLHDVLEEDYPFPMLGGLSDIVFFGSRRDRLDGAGCFADETTIEEQSFCDLHEAIIAAYRYGYL